MGCSVSISREKVLRPRINPSKCKKLKRALCAIRDMKFNLNSSGKTKEELFEIREVCSFFEESHQSQRISEADSCSGLESIKECKCDN
ncbi:unnamed protein product [Blepharisma stoltei]|uniref:Uncharacterized protein n=1 Tax=Blepharisma stoltei TaxID=1481888 RepID=A0AAU9J261_9CILI|nr:unnamed protein product [Blepharisma stoltei]